MPASEPASGAVVLPSNVSPSKYALNLQPDLENFTFHGEETIDVEIAPETSEIVLNSAEIAIQSASVSQGGSQASTRFAGGLALRLLPVYHQRCG